MADALPPYTVASARNAARILLSVSEKPEGMRMVDVAKALKMNVSTCHNILRTLKDVGFVWYDERLKTYKVGLGLINTISTVIGRGDQLSLIRPMLQSLSEQLRMTAILGELVDRREIRLLMSTAPAAGLSLHPPGMEVIPILSGSMGRVAAAFTRMEDSEMRERFQEASHEPGLSFDIFLDEVRQTAERGWAVDDGTWQQGIWGIAAPILSETGKPDKIVCLATTVDRMAPDRVEAVAAELLLTAQAISHGLFAEGPA